MDIQRARPEDAQFLKRIADQAYRPYIRRIGRRPAPMLADFPALIAAGEVWTLSEVADIVGYVVMRSAATSLHVENVAVHPEQHGRGFGRALLEFAEEEAARRGHDTLDLYTNAKMTENLSLYHALGWTEVGRRTQGGFDRVFFEKRVTPVAS
ncbi:MAG: GNAT family N-acetyltransferase [Pseudomonadota bacterium]